MDNFLPSNGHAFSLLEGWPRKRLEILWVARGQRSEPICEVRKVCELRVALLWICLRWVNLGHSATCTPWHVLLPPSMVNLGNIHRHMKVKSYVGLTIYGVMRWYTCGMYFMYIFMWFCFRFQVPILHRLLEGTACRGEQARSWTSLLDAVALSLEIATRDMMNMFKSRAGVGFEISAPTSWTVGMLSFHRGIFHNLPICVCVFGVLCFHAWSCFLFGFSMILVSFEAMTAAFEEFVANWSSRIEAVIVFQSLRVNLRRLAIPAKVWKIEAWRNRLRFLSVLRGISVFLILNLQGWSSHLRRWHPKLRHRCGISENMKETYKIQYMSKEFRTTLIYK